MKQSRGIRNNNPGNIDYNKNNNWHVDIVSRVELAFDPVFLVEPNDPIHNFAGV